MDRYAVIGNPVAHSRSPEIHAAFAAQTAQQLIYERLLAPLGAFEATVAQFRAEGGRGLNVTVPFKEEAYQLATTCSVRAEMAGAVNTLRFDEQSVYGDNTDGVGLVRDLVANNGVVLRGARVLLLGAGGAARGVIGPLLETQPQRLAIANRTVEKAQALAASRAGAIDALPYEALSSERFDVVINATSAGLSGEAPAVPDELYKHARVAYDMVYGAQPTAFLQRAATLGVVQCIDGLGMLVEQAAESFYIWRGVRPTTAPVLAQLRAALRA